VRLGLLPLARQPEALRVVSGGSPDVGSGASAPKAGLELALFDSKVRCKFGIVAAHFGDELLGVFAGEQHVDGIAERVLAARSVGENHEDAHALEVARFGEIP